MKIVIVGSGTSGWMTAAALCKTFPNWDITMIRSGAPIGTGESLTPHVNQYLHFMGIDDKTFLREARATYKSSSRFEDFHSIGHVFHYPNGQSISKQPQMHNWMLAKAYHPDICPPFADVFMPFVTIAEEGKLPMNDRALFPYDISKDRAFHIDGAKFSAYLQETFCDTLTVVDSKVDSVRYNGGRISGVFLERGPTDLRAPSIDADLYIDCTGQASTLGGAQSRWVPYENIRTDTAIVRRKEYTDKDKEMVPYTNAKGMSAGWKWTIPTWDFISEGYVFSSKHQTEEEAKKEFGDGKVIKFKNGRYEDAWVGNCVKIGLSYGFIEPLESTSLFNTHHGILALIDTLSDMWNYNPGQFERDIYNHNMREHLDGWKEFVEAHYYYSSRRDTPFWREVTDEIQYKTVDVQSGVATHEFIKFQMTSDDPVPHDQTPITFILAGSEYTNINKRRYAYHNYPQLVSRDTVEMWQHQYNMRKQLARQMPTMHKYLQDTVFS
jgi:tryptophan halogenase